MRILKLEIDNIRGITHLVLTPNGHNLAIYGPNGSGKSAVVDAIDFLLRGDISRLSGTGTSGISLKKHGPHIDKLPPDAVVRAEVETPLSSGPISLQRSMAKPSELLISGTGDYDITPVIQVAERGEYVLTRRKILKYVTAESGTRAQEVQELLNLGDIEAIRSVLTKLKNESQKELKTAIGQLDASKAQTASTLQLDVFSYKAALEKANALRQVLDGKPLHEFNAGDLKTGIYPPMTGQVPASPTIRLVSQNVIALLGLLSAEKQAEVLGVVTQLYAALIKIRSDPMVLKQMQQKDLLELGLDLIDETGNCPLCDTIWPEGELTQYLKKKIVGAEAAKTQEEELLKDAKTLKERVNVVLTNLKAIVAAATIAEAEAGIVDSLTAWQTELELFRDALASPIKELTDENFSASAAARMLAPERLDELLESLMTIIRAKFPETPPEQMAWDTLTALEQNLMNLESAYKLSKDLSLLSTRSTIFYDTFISARDEVLSGLYDSVRDRFVGLYRHLHGTDESAFGAELVLKDAGLQFEVDFYGRGLHPPHALHSEGHQDSMGLCLYLALEEQLSSGLFNLVVLDDVVMSVDSDHRRTLCGLLATEFPDKQFLITTHDRTWANQLKSESLVSSGNQIEFFGWNVDTGPKVRHDPQIWERIAEDIETENIPAAAALLRRGMEQFCAEACDRLQAKVQYRINAQYQLGDFLFPLLGRYKDLLGEAIKKVRLLGDGSTVEVLEEIDSTRAQIYGRLAVEQWAINPNVHYNEWANFSPEDFRPVAEAFRDFYSLFVCPKCDNLITLATEGLTPAAVRCRCGNIAWVV